MTCPRCGAEVVLNECFKDRAAENELKTATIKCSNQECPWEGPGQFYMVRLTERGSFACKLLTSSQVNSCAQTFNEEPEDFLFPEPGDKAIL